MPGTGFGGLLTNLFNPGLDQQIAASITPNANPLAQQDQPKVPPVPGAPSNPAPGQAPPQVTQGDPALMQTNQLLMQGYLASQRADSINRHIQGMGAAFGTAQQQHDAMAAWQGAQGGGGAGYLDAIAKMQGIDQQQTSQTEHARAAANMQVLAKALGLPDTPEGTAQATEIWNSGTLPDFAKAASENVTKTQETKNVNEYGTLYAKQRGYDPDPSKWTPAQAQDVAGAQANSMAGAMGGNDLNTRQYLAAHASGAFPGTLADWNNQNAASAKEQDATAVNIANAKKILPGVNTTIDHMNGIADNVLSKEDVLKGIFADPNKLRWANSIMKSDPKDNTALNAKQSGGLSAEEIAVIQDAQQLHNMNYRGAFSGEGGVKGIRSQVEADRVSRAADQLGNFTTVDAYTKNLKILKSTYNSAKANAAGEAQAYDQMPESVRYKLDPSYFEGGANASKNLPDWAKVKTVNSPQDYNNLSNGQAYKAPGTAHGNKILIKGYEDQSLAEENY